jgi:CheY-like chemotaxis protein
VTLLATVISSRTPLRADLQIVRPRWARRTLAETLEDQLAGIAAFHEDRLAAEQAVAATGISRELKLDAHRRLDVVRRQHQALIAVVDDALRSAGSPLPGLAPRVMLVHRNEWLRRRVSGDLTARGIEVVAELDNGAEGVGVAIAEQPDLILTEDTLAQVSGMQLLAAACRYAPRTMMAVQVAYADALMGAFDAGAVAAFTRRIPPADIAGELARLVQTD